MHDHEDKEELTEQEEKEMLAEMQAAKKIDVTFTISLLQCEAICRGLNEMMSSFSMPRDLSFLLSKSILDIQQKTHDVRPCKDEECHLEENIEGFKKEFAMEISELEETRSKK